MKPSYLLKALAIAALPLMAQGADEASLDGWHVVGDANFRVENGEIVADMGRGHLVTDESYDDFRITLEFYVDETANSGVYFRITDASNILDSNSYEANIYDKRPDQSGRTGAIVNHQAASEAIDSVGKWNTYDITVQGEHIVVVLNGVKTVDFNDSTYPNSGPIGLQYGPIGEGGGAIKFRNVKIEEL